MLDHHDSSGGTPPEAPVLCYDGRMATKHQILRAIEELPEEAGIDDAIERLILIDKIERGLAQADAGRTVSQEEARKRMARWLP